MKMDCTTTDVSQGTDTLEKRDKATAHDFLYQVLLLCILLNEMLHVSLSSVLSWQGTFLCATTATFLSNGSGELLQNKMGHFKILYFSSVFHLLVTIS